MQLQDQLNERTCDELRPQSWYTCRSNFRNFFNKQTHCNLQLLRELNSAADLNPYVIFHQPSGRQSVAEWQHA